MNKGIEPLIPSDFSETGLLPPRRLYGPVRRYQVVGERSSGTNLVARLLGRNTSLQNSSALGWKHGFPTERAIPADLAVICVVRRADDWALSMHRKPWHSHPALQTKPFNDFIRAPWDTIVDHRKYFRGLDAGPVGAPLAFDRDPATGAPYPDLFTLRRAKLAAMLGYLARDCTALLVCLETVQAAPEAALGAICAALDHPQPNAPFAPVRKRLGSKFNPAVPARPATPDRMDAKAVAFMKERLDLSLEIRLGYTYGN